MHKVIEEILAEELMSQIDILWDNERVKINCTVDIEDMSYVVNGHIDYLCKYEEETNASYMTSVSVYIESIKAYNEDGEIECHLNEHFVEKYLQQYISDL